VGDRFGWAQSPDNVPRAMGELPFPDYRGEEFEEKGWRPSPKLAVLMIAVAIVLIALGHLGWLLSNVD
jgi:hypothetical protein